MNKEKLLDALKSIVDPKTQKDIVELGCVHEIEINKVWLPLVLHIDPSQKAGEEALKGLGAST